MRIVIIGLGGIGGLLANLVWKLCDNPQNELILIDGDEFELGNMPRQYFKKIGNKAECWTKMISDFSPTCHVSYLPEFYPGSYRISDGDIVLIGVDNHYVRRLINEDCKKLRNITVISGGNELTDGNAQFFVIKDGTKVAGDFLDTYHPEIAKAEPEKKKEGCDRRPEPQFLVTNNFVVSAMVNILWTVLNGILPTYSEVYVDVERNQIMPIFRQGR